MFIVLYSIYTFCIHTYVHVHTKTILITCSLTYSKCVQTKETETDTPFDIVPKNMCVRLFVYNAPLLLC